MTTTAKYLFDEDFSGGGKPTITLVEHEPAAGRGRGRSAHSQRARVDRRRARQARPRARRHQGAAGDRGGGSGGRGRRQAGARIDRARADGRDFRARDSVVRVGPEIHELAKEKLEEIAHARGFEGRLVVLSEPGLAAGDCRIEWADGGVAREEAATLALINDAVGRYVTARTGATPENSGRPMP